MKKSQQGFSLIEIMVVLVIIGMLAGIVGPKVFGNLQKAQENRVKADFSNFASALKLYKLDNFKFPSTEQGLEALVSKPSIPPEPKNYKADGYMERLPLDPWGNEYLYLSPGENGVFDIYTYGADGIAGGEGENADIGNWQE